MKTIFVSSTFKDMHYERDAIREITAPLVNEEARRHGDEFDFCDLRWGINTGDLDTNEGAKKVLDVCLDEIDRCEPPMVVLLGYRYGWIPGENLIKTAAERKKLELDDLERSVTALEIEYGALCDKKKLDNTLFYFREIKGEAPSDYFAEDDEHNEKEKILALKRRIKDMTGGRIKEYSLKWNGSGFDGVNAFAEMLAGDIIDMFMSEWKATESLTPFERERRAHAAFIRGKNAMFKARQAEAGKLMKDVLSQPVTIIKGGVGSGKSTLFCHMVTELEKLKKNEWTLIPFISGLTAESNSAADIIENTVYFIEEELHLDHYIYETDSRTSDISRDIDGTDLRTVEKKKHTSDEWRDKLAEMCSKYAKTGKKLLIMVDAVEQLTPSVERDQLYFIPTSVSPNIHVVMTCTTDFKTPGREFYTLEKLDGKGKRAVIKGILTRNGRELSKPVINKMLKLKSSDNPLYLSLLVQRLLMMNYDDFTDIKSRGDDMEAIERHQLELIEGKCPDDLDEMSATLLNEAGKRINEKLVSKVAEYLAVSRNGLRKKDMDALLGEEWSEIDFSHFVNYMSDCFLKRDDGRYDFTHKSIRAGFRSRCEDYDGVNRAVLEHFKSLQADDPVRMSEIIYHAIKADDKRFFVDYIIEYIFCDDIAYLHCAALDTYAQCITDNGQWIIDVLNETKEYEADEKLRGLIYFCDGELERVFFRSQKELEILLSVLEANADLARHLCDKLKTDKCKTALLTGYSAIGRVYEEMGGEDSLEHALESYREGLKIGEQLEAELSTEAHKRNLALMCDRVAGMLEKKCDKYDSRTIHAWVVVEASSVDEYYPYMAESQELYFRSFEIRKQLAEDPGTAYCKKELADSYDNIGNIFEELGIKEPPHAGRAKLRQWLATSYKLGNDFRKAVEEQKVRGQLARWHPEIFNEMIDRLNRVDRMFDQLGGGEPLECALKLYQEGLKIRESLIKEPDIAVDLSVSYSHIGNVYILQDGIENLERAKEQYRKCLESDEQWVKESDSVAAKKSFSYDCRRLGAIYYKQDGVENLKQARSFYRKALDIDEQLERELGTVNSKETLSRSYEALAGTYEKTGLTYEEQGGIENLVKAVEQYQKAVEICEQFKARLDSEKSRTVLFTSYEYAVEAYEKLGGRECLEKAVDLYQRRFEIEDDMWEQQIKPLGWLSHYADRYERAAGIYEKLHDRNNLERVRELYDKSLEIREAEAVEVAEKSGDEHPETILAASYKRASEAYKELGKLYEDLGMIYEDTNMLEPALEVYQKYLDIKKRMITQANADEIKSAHAIIYRKMARIYNRLYTEPDATPAETHNLKRAQGLIYIAHEIRRQMERAIAMKLRSGESSERYREIAEVYKELSGIYEELGGEDNLKRAGELNDKWDTYNRKACDLSGTVSKYEYDNVAAIYEEMGGKENLETAITLYEKGLESIEQRTYALDTSEQEWRHRNCYRQLCDSCDKIAQLSVKLEEEIYFSRDSVRRMMERVLEPYQKALETCERLSKEGSGMCKQDLPAIYEKVAGVYAWLRGSKNLERAEEMYLKWLEIKEQMSNELDSAESRRDLYESYSKAAEFYDELEGEEYSKRALELYQKSLEIREKLANILKTEDGYYDLARGLMDVATHPLTTISDRKKLLNQGLSVSKMLHERPKTGSLSYRIEYEQLVRRFAEELDDLA